MKFGVREICDVVFKAKSSGSIGSLSVVPGQPVLFIDSAKTSTIEGAATTVYAQGGRGNTRLLAWEGEKTLTFTVEDALLSPIGFAVLSGAGLFKASASEPVHVHKTAKANWDTDGHIDLTDALGANEVISGSSPVFVAKLDRGSFTEIVTGLKVNDAEITTAGGKIAIGKALTITGTTKPTELTEVFVDFYVEKQSGVTELVIDAGTFGGYYYVEASTLFKRESDGVDMPAEIVIPNVKVQSNFTFSMASTGDPSTFSFVMDAFPGYTRFDRTKKVICAMQIIDETGTSATTGKDSINNDADESKVYN